jgi:hypothetical protein
MSKSLRAGTVRLALAGAVVMLHIRATNWLCVPSTKKVVG